jgi:hypothetical protein
MRSRPASGQVRAGGGVLRLPPAARGSTRARRGAVSPRGARAPLGAALGAKACGDAEQAEPGPTGVRPPPPLPLQHRPRLSGRCRSSSCCCRRGSVVATPARARALGRIGATRANAQGMCAGAAEHAQRPGPLGLAW